MKIRYYNGLNKAMGRGRKPLGERAMTTTERQARFREAHAGSADEPRVRYRRPVDRRGRPQRWHDAVAELVSLQEEYREWLNSLPENLAGSATAPRWRRCVSLIYRKLTPRSCRAVLAGIDRARILHFVTITD